MDERNFKKLGKFCAFAISLAELSQCKRRQVSCIIFDVKMRYIAAIGYNGPPSGMPNDSCNSTEGDCGCVHAEANALIKAQYEHDTSYIMFTTCAPCWHCAGLIINSGRITQVVYRDSYRNNNGVTRLKAAGIEVYQL